MQTKSKSGIVLEITVAGYQQQPILTLVSPAEVQGRKIAGRIAIGDAPRNAPAGTERGFHARGDVYIQGAAAVQEIEAAIAALPKKVYRIYLGNEIIDADGDLIGVPQWTHENGGVPGANKGDIVRMLEEAGITDIGVGEATKMWAERVAKEKAPYIEAAKVAGKPVEYRRAVVECRDPDEECSADIAITYMHADGTTHIVYTHTY